MKTTTRSYAVIAISIVFTAILIYFFYSQNNKSSKNTEESGQQNTTSQNEVQSDTSVNLQSLQDKNLRFSFYYPDKIILSDKTVINITTQIKDDPEFFSNYRVPTRYVAYFYFSNDYAPINFTITERRQGEQQATLMDYEKSIYNESLDELQSVSENEFSFEFEPVLFKGYEGVKTTYLTNGRVTSYTYFIEKGDLIYAIYYTKLGNDFLTEDILSAFFVNLELGEDSL